MNHRFFIFSVMIPWLLYGLSGAFPVNGAVIDAGSGRGNPDNRVGGQVWANNKQPSASKIASVSGQVKRLDGSPGAGVRLVFTPDNQAFESVSVIADEQGRYKVELKDGSWRGVACDSSFGYQPLGWQIAILNGEVSNFREQQLPVPEISGVDIDIGSEAGVIHAGDQVNIHGRGFACSGRVLVEVEGMSPVEVSVFKQHRDEQISFDFPQLNDGNEGVFHIISKASFRFIQGPVQSNLASFESKINGVDINSINQPQVSPASSSGSTGSSSGGNTGSSSGKKSATPLDRFRIRK